MSTKDRMVWLDALRLTAGVSMVALHASADSDGTPWATHPQADRILPMLLRAVIYIARTELFIVIAMFLLFLSLEQRPRSYRSTIIEQAHRLLLPFLFWCVVFAFYNLAKGAVFGYAGAVQAELSDPVSWLGYVLLGSVKYHMHFIPTLFGVILLYPLVRVAVRMPALGFGVLACLMVKHELDVTIFAQFWGDAVLPFAVRFVKILTYAGYGLVAASFVAILPRAKAGELAPFVPLLVFASVLLFSFKLVATWHTVETGEWQPDYVPGFWADFLMPVLLFLVALSLSHRNWPAVLSRLAPFSFGIYLCHPIFMDIAEIALKGSALPPIAQVSLKIVFVLSATSAFLLVLRRIGPLAWTIGLRPLQPAKPMPAKPLIAE